MTSTIHANCVTRTFTDIARRRRRWQPNGTVVAMTKTERWYAIVEELRAHRRHVCGINRDVVERARSESNRGSDGSAEYFCR